MRRKLVFLLFLAAMLAGSAQAQFVSSVAHRNSGAPEPPEIGANPLDEDVLIFVDRTHEYNEIPAYLIGAQVIMTANDNKGVSAYELDLTIIADGTLYVFVDNRMGSAGGGLGVDPDIAGMGWLNDDGYVDTGDDIGIDEGGDGDIDQYSSIFSKAVQAGTTVTIRGNTEGHGGNMLSAAVQGPKLKAHTPVPEDVSLYSDTWVNLAWTAGDSAVSHDVYLTDNFDDARDGTGDAFRGNQGDDFLIVGFIGFAYPDGLVPGTTYFWRIDELEADGTKHGGDVWSFTVPPKKAYEPSVADGAKFVATDIELSWTPGFGAKLHTVYFGDDLDTVTNATAGVAQGIATFTPGPLALDTTYYWRVDEVDPPFTHTGDVWSFSTLPDIPITDPNLVGWWKFEAGAGTTVLDFSGHGNHGTIAGAANLQWVEGLFNLALEFPGDNQGYVELPADMVTSASGSVTMWVNTDLTDDEGMLWYGTEGGGDGFGGQNELHLHIDDPGVLGFALEGATDVRLDGPQVAGIGWTHVAVTWDPTDGCRLYSDGAEVAFTPHNNTIVNFTVIRLGRPVDTGNGNRFFQGAMDDVRLFDHAITAAQVSEIMTKGENPLLAGNPSPRSNSLPGVDDVPPLTWSAGETASQHDVYFGTDKDAVDNADASDTTGVYRGSQSATTFTPAELLEWGTGPYYWRIDEINTDGTTSKGTVWSFTISDFTLVDGFESYTDNDADGEAIWQYWIDGFGVTTNGSQAGYTLPPYAEKTIVQSGGQSLPLQYANIAGATNSEVELKLTSPRDWTSNGVEELSIWFQGQPASVGSFTEGPVGTFTMTATGADIWNEADEFHFAYKTLTGTGSIEAQILNVENTNSWAKCGVMIRETLDAGSKFGAVYIMPTNADGSATNGVRFQARTDTDVSATSDSGVATDEQKAVVAPYWVKLERDVAGNLRGYYSSNGTAWTPMTWNPQSISMTGTIYIGLALTSHDNNATGEAKFSNVRTTGTVGPIWSSQDIGIAANASEPLYVAISNATGAPAVVTHSDPAAANADTWTEWVIPLQAFADQGINLANVDKMAIGLGTTGGAAAGGSGVMYIDDIALYRTRGAVGQ